MTQQDFHTSQFLLTLVETSLYIPRAYHSALHIIGAQRLFADWMNLYSNSTYLTIYEYIACR